MFLTNVLTTEPLKTQENDAVQVKAVLWSFPEVVEAYTTAE